MLSLFIFRVLQSGATLKEDLLFETELLWETWKQGTISTQETWGYSATVSSGKQPWEAVMDGWEGQIGSGLWLWRLQWSVALPSIVRNKLLCLRISARFRAPGAWPMDCSDSWAAFLSPVVSHCAGLRALSLGQVDHCISPASTLPQRGFLFMGSETLRPAGRVLGLLVLFFHWTTHCSVCFSLEPSREGCSQRRPLN
jgi:hypothetical protein